MKQPPVNLALLALALFAASAQAQSEGQTRPSFGVPTVAPERLATPAQIVPASGTERREPARPEVQPVSMLELAALPRYPINLPAALQLAGASPLDIALATQRLRIARAELERANVLWLPTVMVGADYARHDGRIQDVAGRMISTNKSSLMGGVGPSLVVSAADALYAPLAARQVVRARTADVEASGNDALLAVAESYFQVQQARGELAGAEDAARRAAELARRVDALAEAFTPPFERNRATADLLRRRQLVESALERWQMASAELTRLLRLPPAALVEPLEPPHLRVDLVDVQRQVDELIPVALLHRPELASQKALVEATLARLKQEKMRPLVPSVLLRGNATSPAGTLSSGVFGGGFNDQLSHFGMRNSLDLQLLWEFQGLGLGNKALVRQRREENELALLSLFRTQDQVAAEVVQAHAQATRALQRLRLAEQEVQNARVTADRALEGLKQTRLIGGTNVLIVRPQEAVAAVQGLDQAYRGFYVATADANRAQFRLYRALGQPAHCLAERAELQAIVSTLPPSSHP